MTKIDNETCAIATYLRINQIILKTFLADEVNCISYVELLAWKQELEQQYPLLKAINLSQVS